MGTESKIQKENCLSPKRKFSPDSEINNLSQRAGGMVNGIQCRVQELLLL